jgi:predicted transcriptional regulator
VVDGRQRLKAVLEANKRLVEENKEPYQIRALVEKLTDTGAYEIQILSNEHRTADKLSVKAEKAQRLMTMGRTVNQVANLFGVTPQAVKSWLMIFDCVPAVKKALDGGTLPLTAVKDLAKLPREKQEKAIGKLEKLAASSDKKKVTQKEAKAELSEGGTAAPGKKAIKKVYEYLLAHKADQEEGDETEKALLDVLAWVMEGTISELVDGLISAATEAHAAVDGAPDAPAHAAVDGAPDAPAHDDLAETPVDTGAGKDGSGE